MTTATPGSRPWPEHWAIFAAAEADRIEYQMRVARPDAVGGRAAASVKAIDHHLAAARAACTCSGRRRRRRRGLADRWRGASVEQAFRHLHAAKQFLVDLLPQAEVDALVPDVLTRMGTALNRGDPRRAAAESALRSRNPATRRAALKQAMAGAYDASDDEYSRLRDFRNIIVLTAIGLTLFIGVLIAVVNNSPKAIPLCFEPSLTATSTAQQEQQANTVCPSGDRQRPTGGDVLIVAGLGAVGGGLGALFAIRNLRGTSTPYGIPTALAVLKVPAGALTAVIGILLLAGGFVPGLSNLDSQRQILAYGLLFGYAQQLITRLVDDQGQQLLERVPSKDSQSVPPSVPLPPADVGTGAGAPAAEQPPVAGEVPVDATAGTGAPAYGAGAPAYGAGVPADGAAPGAEAVEPGVDAGSEATAPEAGEPEAADAEVVDPDALEPVGGPADTGAEGTLPNPRTPTDA